MRLARDDVDGLGALVPGLGVIADACALGQRLVAVTADAAVMDEEVLAGLVGRDEPEPLVIAEPLHGSCSHVMYLHGVCALRTRRCCKATTAGAEHCGAERNVRSEGLNLASRRRNDETDLIGRPSNLRSPRSSWRLATCALDEFVRLVRLVAD